MLIVIADIPRDCIQRSVVRISFKALSEHVVLRYEVSGDRMKSHRYQCRPYHIQQHSNTKKVDYYDIECELYEEVNDFKLLWILWIHPEWT